MRKSQIPILILLIFGSVSAWAQVACPTANPITVTRTTGSTGTSGSLPWAINCLNNVTTLTTIQFNIPGAGPHIIQPITNGPFPTITKANALIDGSTDNIVIDGSLGQGQGLNISANSAKIVGLTLRNFSATAAPYPLRLNSGSGHEVSNCQIFDNQVGISIARSAGGVNISSNYIGVDKSGTNLSNSVAGIQFEAYVGAAAAPVANITTNTIGQNTLGIQVGTARNVVISNNSIFCNRSGGISRASAFTIPTITNATTSQITGTAPAASKVEVYRVDNTGCTGIPCQGKTFLGTVTAGAFGTWSLSITSGLSNNDQVTATMTQSNNTSEFSACRTVVDVCANFLASIKSNNVTCNKGSDGSATVSTSGGLNQGINFVWSTAATTATISNLKAGDYTVTATDGAGCRSIQLVLINEPPAISMRTTLVNVACNGDKSGQINTVVAGGNSPYTYKWSNGATTANLVNLVAGTYTLTVTDFSNCTNTTQAIITQPNALSINLSASDTLCAGTKNGTAQAVVSGGTTPYTYLWSTGATTSSIANLGPANYGLTVTDQARCQKIALFQIFEASPLKIDSALVQIKCTGDSAGEINIKVSGGLAPYRFIWENGATTASRKNLKAGTYKLGISDVLGCTETVLFTLKDPAPITAKVVTTDPACFGLNTGTALVDVSSPGPNTYLWSTGATTASLQNLGAGRYGLTVTNANGCKASFPFSINAPSAGIDVTTKVTDINCFGASTGQIQSSTTGGKAPYTYQWSNGATTADLSNLKAGTYGLSVTDQNGCADTATVLITAPTQLQAVISATNASCGNPSGTAKVTVSGGTSPYAFIWSNGATTAAISNLAANTYSVTVTDNLACQVSTSIPITQSAALALTLNGTDIPCNETNTGTAAVQVSGGTAPYSYAWSNGATSSALSALPPGDYAVTVTDAAGCQGNGSQKVGSAPKLNLQIATTNVLCNGQTTGQATASVTGGTPAYAYRWSNGATTSSISSLAAGSYNLTVTDSKQCAQNQAINITQPAALQANATFNRETSANAQNGSASVSATGGTSPYSFKWSTGATTSAITGLGQGQYTVTVQDANGCNLVRTGTVGGESCPALSVSGIATDLACAGAETGSISLSVLGGTAPYVYTWNNGANTSNLTGLNEGTYAVTVTDAKGCTGNFSSTLKAGSRMPKPLYGIVAPDTVCGNETFTLRADDLFPGPKVSYIWQLPNGQELKSSTPSLKLKATSSDFDGEYTAYRDSAGCKSSIFGPVIVDVVSLPANSFSAGRDTTLCQGNNIALKAKAPTNGKASWLSLSTKVSVLDPNSPNTTVQNLNIGANRFVWRIALGKCIQAAADTVTVFLEKAPILADDKYTIERAQDVAAMNILLNDNLAGIKDTTVSWTGAPTQGNFEFIPGNKSFRYTAEPDFRGIIQFQYVVCNKASACATPCDTAQVAIDVFNLPKPTDGLVLEDPGPNGSLQIRGLQGFSRVDITITNRWGDRVYRNENYDNNAPWRGHTGDNGPFLPPGAYYYVISAFDDGKLVGKPQTGAIYLFKKENP
jgi:trimeric autotransporter adhesin